VDGRPGVGTPINSGVTTNGNGTFSFNLAATPFFGSVYHTIRVFAEEPSVPAVWSEVAGSPIEVGTQDYTLSIGPPMGARDYISLFTTGSALNDLMPLALFLFYTGHWTDVGANSIFADVVRTALEPLNPPSALLPRVARIGIEAPCIKPWGDPANLGASE